MKLQNKLLLLLIMVLPLGFTACDDDDDDVDVQPTEEVTELILEKSSIDVEVDDTGTVKITQGGGEYHVFSSNPDIVAVELEGNVVKLSALSRGRTSVIISDKNSQYKELGVVAFYDVLEIETTEINVKMPLGHPKTMRIPITKGNGGYEVSVESEIVSATIENDSEIVLVATKEGEATITLTDSYGLTLDIPVSIRTTTIPYDEKELKEIMANEESRYIFNTNDMHEYYLSEESSYVDGTTMIGLNSSYGYYYKLFFTGDKSVGVKPDGVLDIDLYFAGITLKESVTVEIIKNDGNKVWAVYSYIKNEKLNFGHLCQNINL
ncbi:hypothetical protein [Marinifilum sp. D714]|uniref:hypothetical protein n=1 Tax=Marinifilum sp. D714 TaxID=2937523 RepID=UPI0027CBEEFF|nr:hypothetical protein [Marinifilum sp. D714]MDQ2178700.1 hypothetical protein [Marinifilum sp. D714]